MILLEFSLEVKAMWLRELGASNEEQLLKSTPFFPINANSVILLLALHSCRN